MTPYRWNAAAEVWEFHEPAWGGWCTLRFGPHVSTRPMTFAEGIRHLITYPLCAKVTEPQQWLFEASAQLDIRYHAASEPATADAEATSVSSASAPAGEAPIISDNGFPRRIRVDLWHQAERAIQDAVDVCETTLPADILETEAIILLGKARDKVADLVEREILAGRMPMPSAASRDDGPDESLTSSERAEILAACDTGMRLNVPAREIVGRIRASLATPRESPRVRNEKP
jgi:hypothetical protein